MAASVSAAGLGRRARRQIQGPSMSDRLSTPRGYTIEIFAFLIVVPIVYLIAQHYKRRRLLREIERKAESLGQAAIRNFLIQPCSRCHEFMMKLLEVSPNARSVRYQCAHCKKEMRAPAGNPSADKAVALYMDFRGAVANFNNQFKSKSINVDVHFGAPPAPLPYEQTTRQPIPEAVRSEVWRRDGGGCVKCESREQLEFDHIIPVSRGGATSVRNLQLLCKQCNRMKAAAI